MCCLQKLEGNTYNRAKNKKIKLGPKIEGNDKIRANKDKN